MDGPLSFDWTCWLSVSAFAVGVFVSLLCASLLGITIRAVRSRRSKTPTGTVQIWLLTLCFFEAAKQTFLYVFIFNHQAATTWMVIADMMSTLFSSLLYLSLILWFAQVYYLGGNSCSKVICDAESNATKDIKAALIAAPGLFAAASSAPSSSTPAPSMASANEQKPSSAPEVAPRISFLSSLSKQSSLWRLFSSPIAFSGTLLVVVSMLFATGLFLFKSYGLHAFAMFSFIWQGTQTALLIFLAGSYLYQVMYHMSELKLDLHTLMLVKRTRVSALVLAALFLANSALQIAKFDVPLTDLHFPFETLYYSSPADAASIPAELNILTLCFFVCFELLPIAIMSTTFQSTKSAIDKATNRLHLKSGGNFIPRSFSQDNNTSTSDSSHSSQSGSPTLSAVSNLSEDGRLSARSYGSTGSSSRSNSNASQNGRLGSRSTTPLSHLAQEVMPPLSSSPNSPSRIVDQLNLNDDADLESGLEPVTPVKKSKKNHNHHKRGAIRAISSSSNGSPESPGSVASVASSRNSSKGSMISIDLGP